MDQRFLFVFLILMTFPSFVFAQSVGSNEEVIQNASALLTRHQQRMDMLETGLKEVRGTIENDLREIRLKIEQMQNSSSVAGTSQTADLNSLRNQMEKLVDTLAMTNRRMERTLEITSDTEFRLLRLEKRVQTLLTLGGQDVATALLEQDTIAAGETASVKITRDADTGISSWSVEESALDGEPVPSAEEKVSTDESQVMGKDSKTDLVLQSGEDFDVLNSENASSEVSAKAMTQPEILPAVSPEEQYRFALGRALQNDLESAELAFAEFRHFNKGHAREADSVFWLGRVQFMRGQYEKAAMTFSEFNSSYPGDARLDDTTMWIAESVSHFAQPTQACEIYASLPQTLVNPTKAFLDQLAKLSDAASCNE